MIDRLDVQFDVDKIQSDLEKIVFVDLDFNQQTYQTTNQISLRGDDWFDGNGSLYDYAKQKFVRETAEFSYTSKKLTGTYLEQVIAKVEAMAAADGVKIGRVRVLRLTPRSCYTLHRDVEEFRYHIPLETNRSCFFVVGESIGRMLDIGGLYKFQTNLEHTAINASMKQRVHIVFDTYV